MKKSLLLFALMLCLTALSCQDIDLNNIEWTPVGNTEETILEFRRCLVRYVMTPGNTFPPRYLWRLLWRLYRWEPKRLLERCQKAERKIDLNDFYA